MKAITYQNLVKLKNHLIADLKIESSDTNHEIIERYLLYALTVGYETALDEIAGEITVEKIKKLYR